MASVSHTVSRELSVKAAATFDVVAAEDVLPKVLHRWGPIPGVRGTRDLTGPWDTPGSERTVMLGDGSTAREQVIVWERPWRFDYRVDKITGRFGRLVDHAIGSWIFADTARGSSFEWTYTFGSRGRVSTAPLTALAHTAWARYMEQCADLCVELAGGHA